ncbi:OmpL47-type beta-barrel domain-containing protein [Conexibacter sp. SYSU D00693]|uniref:OmpL47-type beta-barrel domain-containing protein n=1 Tax=Conexibacter sp. SYSU D00693 TaxID=2812560 RepID=UPI00196A9237|nr:hypothetical protein [Conexibacter sp. SYSU D00693]
MQGTKRAALALACAIAGLAGTPGLAHAENAREINVVFQNTSDQALDLTKQDLEHGCWGAGSPPSRIEAGATVNINSRSCGVATGTEFVLEYTLATSKQLLRLHYDNPYVGVSEYREQSPEGYQAVRTGSEGDEARLNLKFSCSSATCDGIPDDWKRNGVTVDPAGPAGPQFIDLPKMGVELDRPNVFVHLDWMQDAAHDQRLRQAAIDRVIRAYDQVPRTWPGASRPGINLVVDQGPDSTIEPGGPTWGSLSRAGSVGWSEGYLTGWREPGYSLTNFYDDVRDRLGGAGRAGIFHYAIAPSHIVPSRVNATTMATEWDNTSGYGVPWGFIVSLGGWTGGVGSEDEQAGTFMHELGHTLGLSHGGADEELPDEDGFKPNFPSVMNYLFQTNGYPRGGQQAFDYSRIDTPDFDETKAKEADGISLGPDGGTTGTGHRCPDGGGGFTSVQVATLKPIDWSCASGGEATTGFDTNGDGRQTVLKGSTSDWSRLQFKRGGVGGGTNPEAGIPAGGTTPPSKELTVEMDKLIAGPDSTAPTTTIHRAPQANADGWNNTDVSVTFTADDGAGGSGVSAIEAAVDLGGFQPVTGPIVLSDEGVHVIKFRSTDKAQNVEAEQTAFVMIDKTTPAAKGDVLTPFNAAGWHNQPVTVRATGLDALAGVKSFTRTVSGAQGASTTTVDEDVTDFVVDEEGATTVSYKPTDFAGNDGETFRIDVRVDRTAPSSTIDVPRGTFALRLGEELTGTATDATSGVGGVTLTLTPQFGAKRDPVTVQAQVVCPRDEARCTWSAPRPPKKGDWLVQASATDRAGNREPAGPSARVAVR